MKKPVFKDSCITIIIVLLLMLLLECDDCIENYKEIETLKKKINKLKKAAIGNKEQHRDLVEKVKEFEGALNEINAYTRGNAKNMPECVLAIKKLLKNTKEKQRLSDNDDTINDLNKRISLQDSEIEELKNVVKKFENDISTMASDMKRKLKLKDDEVDNLKEELDRCKVQSAKDGNLILEKDETIADLQANERKSANKERDLKGRNDDLETRCGQLENRVSVSNSEIYNLSTQLNDEKRRGAIMHMELESSRELLMLRNNRPYQTPVPETNEFLQ